MGVFKQCFSETWIMSGSKVKPHRYRYHSKCNSVCGFYSQTTVTSSEFFRLLLGWAAWLDILLAGTKPKQVLKDGKKWTTFLKEKDYRPPRWRLVTQTSDFSQLPQLCSQRSARVWVMRPVEKSGHIGRGFGINPWNSSTVENIIHRSWR